MHLTSYRSIRYFVCAMATQRITITLPARLAQEVRKEARKGKRSVSSVVAEALAKREEERIRQLMIEGYKAMAEENERMAEEFLPAAAEALPDDTAW